VKSCHNEFLFDNDLSVMLSDIFKIISEMMLRLRDYITGFLLYNKKLITDKKQGNRVKRPAECAKSGLTGRWALSSHKKKLSPAAYHH